MQQVLLGLLGQVTTHSNELTQFRSHFTFTKKKKGRHLRGFFRISANVAACNVHRSGGAGLAATTLGGALDDYLKVVSRDFLRRDFKGREETLRAYAEDHIREIVRSPKLRPKAA
jgi:hypothetical protein